MQSIPEKKIDLSSQDEKGEISESPIIREILLAVTALTILWAWYPIFFQGGMHIIFPIAMLALEIIMFFFLQRNKVKLVQLFFPLCFWLIVLSYLYLFGGIRNSGFLALAIIVCIAGILGGYKSALLYTSLSVVAGFLFVAIENEGLLPSYTFETRTTILLSYSAIVLAIGVLTIVTNRAKKQWENQQQHHENDLRSKIHSLRNDYQVQAQHVHALEEKKNILDFIINLAGSTKNCISGTELFEIISRLFKEYWHVDHTSIYLIDDLGQSMLLKYTNTDLVGHSGPNQRSLRITKSAPISLSGEADAIKIIRGGETLFVESPGWSIETKTSRTLPLSMAGECVGIINLQFLHECPAFPETELVNLLLDQIGLMMEKVLSAENRQKIPSGQKTHHMWKILESGKVLGFQYDRIRINPYSESLPPHIQEELAARKTVTYTTHDSSPVSIIASPIILANNVIGVVGYEDPDPQHEWHPTEKAMLETIATRASLALENSRLVAEAEQRAEREQMLGKITARMRETLDIESIIQTTLQELHQHFPLTEAQIRLQLIEPESEDSTKLQP